jgi:hypothetical protein
MPADDFWDYISSAYPLITAEECIPNGLCDDRAGTNVRHCTGDVVEEHPPFAEKA